MSNESSEVPVTGRRGRRQTKYEAVCEAIRSEIDRGVWAPGEQIPSEQSIGLLYGVAPMTARQAVSALVAEGALERVGRKGTFVARERQIRTPAEQQRVVLLVEGGGNPSLDPYYLPCIVGAFEMGVNQGGRRLTTLSYQDAILGRLLKRTDLICCVLLNEWEALHATQLADSGYRVFAINRIVPESRISYLSPDNFAGGLAATEHLISLGHRRIGFIRGIPTNIDGAERRAGYIHAMNQAGLTPGPELGDNFVESCGHAAASQMLEGGDPPTAIFCASDLSAMGAMKAIFEAGLSVPDDVSIVGFGDFSVAGFLHPGLTTVRLPLNEIGSAAALQVLKMANGEGAQTTILPCPLVLRQTTGPCRKLAGCR